MRKPLQNPKKWKLPEIEDFTRTPDPKMDLDGYWAWKNFGGLTIKEAYLKFCTNSIHYQEHFMWMGDAAFLFYFPVIDRYIREKELEYQFDEQAHFLSHCIDMHVSEKQDCVKTLYGQIVKLCHFVLHGLKNIKNDNTRTHSPQEIEVAWNNLLNKTLALM